MIINLRFTPKNTKKVRKAVEVIKNSLPRTPKSKARTFINIIHSQSPITKTYITSNTSSTSSTTQEIELTLYNTLRRRCDRFSNCSGQLVMKAIADRDEKKNYFITVGQLFRRQFHKMVTHTQTIRRQIADELFERV